MGQIDDPATVEGTAIVDADHGGAAVPQIGDPDLGAERKGTMGGREGAAADAIRFLAVGTGRI
jgi:hypothetical protein